MHPKSLCMRYFFVDALAHCIKNALFVECVSASTKKSSAYTHPFFCRCAGALHKKHTLFVECISASTKK